MRQTRNSKKRTLIKILNFKIICYSLSKVTDLITFWHILTIICILVIKESLKSIQGLNLLLPTQKNSQEINGKQLSFLIDIYTGENIDISSSFKNTPNTWHNFSTLSSRYFHGSWSKISVDFLKLCYETRQAKGGISKGTFGGTYTYYLMNIIWTCGYL